MTDDPPSLREMTTANRAAWDASEPLHRDSDSWPALLDQARRGGFTVLDETLTATFEALSPRGKRVVQIGCNNGRELLSAAALGATPALGIDHSAAFLKQAGELAEAAGVDAQFLCADIYALPDDVPRDFDIALITIGVLGWMPDLARLFQVISGLLAPGGRLVIYETHPFLEMFDPHADDPFTPRISYFADGPYIDDGAITYDGPTGAKAGVSYWFVHKLGDIVTACIEAGLRVDRLTEHAHSNREADFDIYCGRDAQLPMCFTMVATKPTRR